MKKIIFKIFVVIIVSFFSSHAMATATWTVDIYGTIINGGSATPNWLNNIAIVTATTTNANDSIKITGYNGTALSSTNVGRVTLPDVSNPGASKVFNITSNITLLISGITPWGDGTGNLTGALLRVGFDNDNGTLRTCVAYLGGRNTLLTTDTTATQANVSSMEHVLCDTAVSSASNTFKEIGFVRGNFTDATNVWATQTGVNDIVTGIIADGYWQPWNIGYSAGFSANPTTTQAIFTQETRKIKIYYERNAAGTSSTTGLILVLPTKAKYTSTGGTFKIARPVDNGADVTAECIANTAAGSTLLSVFPNKAAGNWTAAGNKGVDVSGWYEVGPSASFIE